MIFKKRQLLLLPFKVVLLTYLFANIFQLKEEIRFNSSVQPTNLACGGMDATPPGTKVTVLGWGANFVSIYALIMIVTC